jgi:hypothetical protein
MVQGNWHAWTTLPTIRTAETRSARGRNFVRRRQRRTAAVVLASLLVLAGSGAALASIGTTSVRSANGSPRLKSRSRPDFAYVVPPRGKPPFVPPLPEPTVRDPLRMLVIGDSLGEDLGMGLQDLLSGQEDVVLYPKAVGSTGLVNTSYYDWPAVLPKELALYRPQLVVVLFGGNDALSFDQNGTYVPFGSSLWREDYGARVASIIQESESAGARVAWVGLPMMGPTAVLSNASMQALNSVYQEEAAKYPGTEFIPTWTMFTSSNGQYATDMRDSAGTLVVVRDGDGVHIAPTAGTELIASLVVDWIDVHDGIHLCPVPSDIWRTSVPAGCPMN